jgi:predicted PurR-regulated permease PerM
MAAIMTLAFHQNVPKNIMFWINSTILCCIFLIAAFFWGVSSVLSPFILGMALAYVFHPMVRIAKRYHISPVAPALFIMCLIYLFFALLMVFVIPYLKRFSIFVSHHWITSHELVWHFVEPWFQKFTKYSKELSSIHESLNHLVSFALHFLGQTSLGFLENSFSIARFFTTLVLAPLIAFHFLKDGQCMLDSFFHLIPERFRVEVQTLFADVDQSLSFYLRGQMIVSSMLSAFYVISFYFLGLHFALLIGVLTGFLSFIPYVGIIIGLSCAALSALFSGFTWSSFIALLGVFLGGQMIESSFLTPFIIGKKTGTHPLFILFSVFAGGALKGFVGVLVALPVCTMVAAIWRFARKHYFKSHFYLKKSDEIQVK